MIVVKNILLVDFSERLETWASIHLVLQTPFYLGFPSAEVYGEGYGLADVSLVCCVIRNLVPVNSFGSNADHVVVFCVKPHVLNMVSVIKGC
jgi:hypothetical protein